MKPVEMVSSIFQQLGANILSLLTVFSLSIQLPRPPLLNNPWKNGIFPPPPLPMKLARTLRINSTGRKHAKEKRGGTMKKLLFASLLVGCVAVGFSPFTSAQPRLDEQNMIIDKDAVKQIAPVLKDQERDETSPGEAFVRVLQMVEQCIENCGRWDQRTTSCVPDTHYVKDGDRCVCDAAHHYVQARRTPTTMPDTGLPRCVQPVSSVNLKIQTATFEDSGTDDSFIFLLCNQDPLGGGMMTTEIKGRDLRAWNFCFQARFSDSGPLGLNGGDFEEIRFGGTGQTEGVEVLPSSRPLSEFVYPDDFQFFAIIPDYEGGDWGNGAFGIGGGEGFDGWTIAGLELAACPMSGSCVTMYRNPVVNRWIDTGSEHSGFGGFVVPGARHGGYNYFYSPHYIHNSVGPFDDFFGELPPYNGDFGIALYIETDDVEDAGTDDTILARVPILGYEDPTMQTWIQALSFEALNWITAVEYAKGMPEVQYEEVPHMMPSRIGANAADIVLTWEGYEDFPRNGKTSYGVTVPNSNGQLDKKIQIITQGSDAWKIKRVKAYMFCPGCRDFIENQKCYFTEASPNAWLSTDRNEGIWAFPLSYWELEETTCPSFNTIQWGNGINGAYGFGRR